MKKNLLAVTLFALCYVGNAAAADESKKVESVETVTEKTEEKSEDIVSEDLDEMTKITTPLKVVNGEGSNEDVVIRRAMSMPNTVEVTIENEDIEDAEASLYNVNGKLIGKEQLKYPLTEISFNQGKGVYIMSVVKNGKRLHSSKFSVN